MVGIDESEEFSIEGSFVYFTWRKVVIDVWKFVSCFYLLFFYRNI